MKKLVLVKLGGSLITQKDKPFTKRLKVIRRLAKEIHTARQSKDMLIVLGHGGGSYPHVPAKKYKVFQGIISNKSYRGISEVQNTASTLNRIVVQELMDANENAVSLQPSSFIVSKNGRIEESFLSPLKMLLKFNMVPVVYGDVVLDTAKGCSIISTETILNFLALKLKSLYTITKIIYCGSTPGVLVNGKTIPVIRLRNFIKVKNSLGISSGIDVTGGMLHKVEEGLKIAKKGVQVIIINGRKKNELIKTLLNDNSRGTIISG